MMAGRPSFFETLLGLGDRIGTAFPNTSQQLQRAKARMALPSDD
jgi:hypothetical protein